MPRIKELKPLYMEKDIGAIIAGLMFRAKFSQTKMASALGLTQGGLNYKLRNNSFTYKDLIVIFHELELSDAEIVRLMKI